MVYLLYSLLALCLRVVLPQLKQDINSHVLKASASKNTTTIFNFEWPYIFIEGVFQEYSIYRLEELFYSLVLSNKTTGIWNYSKLYILKAVKATSNCFIHILWQKYFMFVHR